MSSIDERVVAMKFDNSQFEHGVKTTLGSLDSLNKGLKLDGATAGLSNIAAGVENLASRLKASSIIGIAALASLTTKAIDAGVQLGKTFVLDPIRAGFQNYETQINAVQTILANTSAQGVKIGQVNKVLAELNTYANQTVYNFSDMTRNIGTFTAAGVGLEASVSSIKGIANLAAMSGASAEQASGAMYQLSQAIAAGSVKLQDWNSVVNAGLGGKTFQDALVNTARVSGVAIDSIIKKSGSFRNSLQQGWLTSQILTKTLSQFTGDLSLKQLEAMGYSKAQAQQIFQMGQTAVNAATKIKTLTQLSQALKEEVATAYAAIFKTIFGDIGEATDLFSAIHTAAENALTGPIYALNTLLQGWDKLGGRKVLIQGLTDAVHILGTVLKSIKDGFREVFPPATAKQLYDITVSFRNFIERLKMGGETADKLKRTFAGVFAILGIGWDILKQVVKVIANVFGFATKGSGGILTLTAKLGDFLVKIRNGTRDGEGFLNFFRVLTKVIEAPIRWIREFIGLIGEGFHKASNVGGAAADRVQSRLSGLGKLGETITKIWGGVVSFFKGLGHALEPVVNSIGDAFSKLGDMFKGGKNGVDFNVLFDALNAALLTGIGLVLRKFFKNFKSLIPGQGLFKSVKESLEGVTGALKAMQTNLKASALIKIAAALAILTISVVALSMVDSAKLAAAVGALTIMTTQLFASMAIFEKISGSKGFAKMPFIAASIVILSIAVDILASAAKKLASLDWNGLSKGLTGLTVLLGEVIATMKLMPDGKRLISAGLGLLVLSTGIKVLVGVMKDLSALSWSDLAKGLIGVGAILAGLSLFTKFSDTNKVGLLKGAGILLLALAIKMLVDAVSEISKLSWENIAKGLLGLSAALVIVVGAMDSIPATAVLSGAGMLIVATSLVSAAKSLQIMGSMSWGNIAKGLVGMLGVLTLIATALIVVPPEAIVGGAAIYLVSLALLKVATVLDQFSKMSWEAIGKSITELAGALLVISVALILMEGAVGGAVAMIIVAGALAIMAPVLEKFGQMSLGDIGKSLLMLAGAFLVLGVAGVVLTPVILVILALGVAIALLGIGLLAVGAGILAFAMGLTLLSKLGDIAAGNLVSMITKLLGLIPLFMQKLAEGIVAFANVIAKSGPQITGAIVTVLNSLLNAIGTMTPKIVETLYRMLDKMLQTLANHVPNMVNSGMRLIVGILNGIANHIGGVVNAATNIIVNFINGIANGLPRIIQSGVNLILSFVNGIANAIRSNSAAMGRAGGNLASAIIEGMANGIMGGVGAIINAAENVAKSALQAAKNFLGIKSPSKEFFKIGQWSSEGMANGLTAYSGVVSKSAEGVGQTALDAMRKKLSGIGEAVKEIDARPTIRPILDLTDIHDGATRIKDILKPLPLGISRTNAQDASNGYTRNWDAVKEAAVPVEGRTVAFTQNNYSPKALSSAEIYRQTKNQLSVAKGAL